MQIGFKGFHPVSSFLFFVFTFAVSLCFSHPLLLASSIICALSYSVKLGGKTAVKKFFFFHLPMILLITAFNFAFSHYGVTTLFEMQNGNRFTLEALVYGLVFGLKASAVILWLGCFNEVISSDKFIFLFGRFSPKTALVISMVLRFIPLFEKRAREIENARRGLGIDAKNGNILTRFKNSIHSISILITWILENAIDTANSMTARGYGLKGRKSYNSFLFAFRDKIFVLLTVVISVLFVVFRESFYSVFNPIIEISPLSLSSVLLFITFVLFGLSPLIIDLREEKLWSK